MPFLDAKALETDPEGLAFLRAVLKPAAKTAKANPPGAAPAESRRLLKPQPPQGEVSLGLSRGAHAPAP